MLFNVYNQDNEIIGQVEAEDSAKAWIEAMKKYPLPPWQFILDIREVIAISPYLAEGEYWIAKSVYDNWRVRAERFVSKDEWSKEILKYYGVPIMEIPVEIIPLNWYEVIREEYRDNYPGYIVKVYSK